MRDYVRKTTDNPLHGSPVLERLDIELTERCNNNCIHCYINLPCDDPAMERELSTGALEKILIEAASLGCLTVRFTGGEPLIRDDFEEIYLFTRRLGIKIVLFTNATLITPHLADLFSQIPPREKIEISIYGLCEGSYEAVTRVPGSFQAAMRGLKLLWERGVPFVIKAAVLPPNIGELGAMEDLAMEIPWMEGHPPVYSSFFNLRARRDSEDKNRIIRSLRPSPQEGIEILSRDRDRYLQEMKQFCTKFMKPSGDQIFSCGAGKGGCVDAYGNFQPCILLRHPQVLYDLRSGTIKDALIRFFPRLREMKANNPDYLSRCARCFLKGLCEQCPGRSWMEHGTMDTPMDYFCQVAHARALDLGMLQRGEKAWEVEDWKERIKALGNK